ncbi:MAG: M20 family peptidase [Eubacteriales bacterium]|nr:M20 family peptidase [Eubacteriales bacterium]
MVLWILLGLIALWLAVVLLRAAAFTPRAQQSVDAQSIPVDEQAALSRFADMIRCKTVSYPDSEKEAPDEFTKFQALLTTAYPAVTAACPREILGRRGLVYHWKGKSDKAPSVLMAHYDVVPVEEGEWSNPPFSGLVKDGELWGRGTLDTKGTLHGVMEAAEYLIKQGFVPENDIYLTFGGDEEIFGGDQPAIVSEFEKRGIHPRFVLDEGGAIVDKVFPGVTKSAAVIGTAEKGSICVDLAAKGKGGHASAPPPEQSMGILSKALCRLQDTPMPFTMTPAASATFDTMGRESSFTMRILFANLWCFAPLLNLVCKKSGGELNALVRTTCALTKAQGSAAYNVLPSLAKAGVNLRLISGDTIEAAMSRMKTIINDERVSLSFVSGENPGPVSVTGDEPWERLDHAVRAAYPGVLVCPYLMLAGSDSRHYCKISEHVYRFSGMPMTKEQRGLIHNANERIPVSQIKDTINFYAQVLKQC